MGSIVCEEGSFVFVHESELGVRLGVRGRKES